VHAHAKCKVSGNVCGPRSWLKGGDAAFLDSGMPLLQVKGEPPDEMLAERFRGRIVAYGAMAPMP